jgi:ABC-type Fe3+-hydroxamate transport system substrate-binding protein
MSKKTVYIVGDKVLTTPLISKIAKINPDVNVVHVKDSEFSNEQIQELINNYPIESDKRWTLKDVFLSCPSRMCNRTLTRCNCRK